MTLRIILKILTTCWTDKSVLACYFTTKNNILNAVNYHNICDYWPAKSVCPLFRANADVHLLIFKDFIKIKFQGHL